MRNHNAFSSSFSQTNSQCTTATFSQDSACEYSGRGLSYSSGTKTFKYVEFTSCIASDDHGGAIKCTGANTELIVTKCTFTDCHANDPSTQRGGGIYAQSIKSVTTLSCFFTSCSGFWGGGFYINLITSTPDFSDCVFTSCRGYDHGAGAFVGRFTQTSFVACNTCLFLSCTNYSSTSTLSGGGFYLDIYTSTHVNTVSNVLFTKNSVNSQGGGLRIYEDEMNLDYSLRFCVFSSNTAPASGQDIALRRITFNFLLHCHTKSDAPDRLYLFETVFKTGSSTDTTQTPNWLP